MRDLYQEVTKKIVAALEAGTAPWLRPWSAEFDPVPVNAGSRRPYRGINRILLTLEAQLRGYERNGWLTYRQAAELGAQVRGGEHGTTVVFSKQHELPTDSQADGSDDGRAPRVIPLLRAFTVFNVQQIDRLPERLCPPPVMPSWSPRDEAERLLEASGARIQHGGARAFYSPPEDRIQLPALGAFKDAESYYGTAIHELTHWTGHPSRLDRQLGKRFGDEAYAMEELIAEMGAAFLCAHCRIEGRLQHAEYIGNWLTVLKDDKRAVFTAATKAQQAADFILTQSNAEEKVA